jgi:hypothetical protein
VFELATGDVLLHKLDGPAIGVVKNVDHAVLIEKGQFDKVVEFVRVDLIFHVSVLAVLALLHDFPLLIKNLHLVDAKIGYLSVSAIASFPQNNRLEWAHQDDLMVDIELLHGLSWENLKAGKAYFLQFFRPPTSSHSFFVLARRYLTYERS